METKTIKTATNEILTITKTRRDFICVNPIKKTHQHKWVWTAENGIEWTPMCGEWRKVVDRYGWRTGTVLGKEASRSYVDRAFTA